MNLTSTRVLASLMVAAGLALTAAAEQTTTLFPAVDTFETDESWFDPAKGNTVSAAADMAATDYKSMFYQVDEQNSYGVKAWIADGADESTLVAETYEYSAQPYPMNLTAGQMFLNLNTAGATLSRQLGDFTYDGEDSVWTPGASFAEAPIWVDTMIKFVKSDETPTSIPGDVKLAMWVNADNKLVIYSDTMDDEGTQALLPVATVTTVEIDPESWYRVTVETFCPDDGLFVSRVWINGVPVDGIASIDGWAGTNYGRVLFPSVDTASANLKSVSFKGTGAVDDLTVSYTEATFSNTPASFTLTIDFDSELLTVTAGGETITDTTAIASGSSVTVTANDWYQITAITANATATADAVSDLTGRATTATFTAIASGADAKIEVTAQQYSEGTFGANDANAKKASDWGIANHVSTSDFDDYYNQYLLNIAPDGDATIAIDSVAMGEDTTGNATATIVVKAANGVDWDDINGDLSITVSTDLTTWTPLPADYEGLTITPDETDATKATITVVLPEGNKYFVKALVK